MNIPYIQKIKSEAKRSSSVSTVDSDNIVGKLRGKLTPVQIKGFSELLDALSAILTVFQYSIHNLFSRMISIIISYVGPTQVEPST